MDKLISTAIFFIAALPAIVFHEVAHGYVSYMLGDPTAKQAGRLTLNPLKHIDPFGTILLPLILSWFGTPFGYAKPVPINPYFYKNYRRGMLLTGLAGPATNLALAIVCGTIVRFAAAMTPAGGSFGTVGDALLVYLFFLTEVNLVLMFFNLIPIPPFDGSRVIPVFLSDNGMRAYAKVEQYGFIIIIAVLFFLPGALRTYFGLTVDPLLRLIVGNEAYFRFLLGV